MSSIFGAPPHPSIPSAHLYQSNVRLSFRKRKAFSIARPMLYLDPCFVFRLLAAPNLHLSSRNCVHLSPLFRSREDTLQTIRHLNVYRELLVKRVIRMQRASQTPRGELTTELL